MGKNNVISGSREQCSIVLDEKAKFYIVGTGNEINGSKQYGIYLKNGSYLKSTYKKTYVQDNGKYAYELDDVTVTSVKLGPLSAVISYEFSGVYPAFEWDGNHVYAVMKDGTSIMLEDNWSRWDGYNVLKVRSPIFLDEVDHVLLADGTKLMVP